MQLHPPHPIPVPLSRLEEAEKLAGWLGSQFSLPVGEMPLAPALGDAPTPWSAPAAVMGAACPEGFFEARH